MNTGTVPDAATVTEVICVPLLARYSGPTDTRGSAIRVWRADDSPRTAVRVAYDHGRSLTDNYRAGFAEYLARKAWGGDWLFSTSISGDAVVSAVAIQNPATR